MPVLNPIYDSPPDLSWEFVGRDNGVSPAAGAPGAWTNGNALNLGYLQVSTDASGIVKNPLIFVKFHAAHRAAAGNEQECELQLCTDLNEGPAVWDTLVTTWKIRNLQHHAHYNYEIYFDMGYVKRVMVHYWGSHFTAPTNPSKISVALTTTTWPVAGTGATREMALRLRYRDNTGGGGQNIDGYIFASVEDYS